MTCEWKDLPASTLQAMKDLGNFGPTANAHNREIKGYMHHDNGDDGRTYFDSHELRVLAVACIDVADWLDARANDNQA